MTKLTDYRKRISNKAIKLLDEIQLSNIHQDNNKNFIRQLKLQLKMSGRLWLSPKQFRWLEDLYNCGDDTMELYGAIYDFCD